MEVEKISFLTRDSTQICRGLNVHKLITCECPIGKRIESQGITNQFLCSAVRGLKEVDAKNTVCFSF